MARGIHGGPASTWRPELVSPSAVGVVSNMSSRGRTIDGGGITASHPEPQSAGAKNTHEWGLRELRSPLPGLM